jgi:uncharacterized protein YqeY
MLSDEIKRRMVAAMKAGQALEKGILKLALGEVQTAEARSGEALDDDKVAGILRKLIKSNRESLDASTDEAQRATLQQEIEVLDALLPKTLGADEIAAALEPVKDAILGAGNDGQATGIAMKHLKAEGAAVQGKDVAQAVRAMRG